MKTLVVYYSRTGTTEVIAKLLAYKLHADIEQLKDTKNRSGIFGYFFAGRDGMLKHHTMIVKTKRDPSSYDLVIVGTPIWVNLTPAVRTYLSMFGRTLRKCAFFCTMGGSGGGPAFTEMEQLCGKKPEATLELAAADMESNSYKEKVAAFARSISK